MLHMYMSEANIYLDVKRKKMTYILPSNFVVRANLTLYGKCAIQDTKEINMISYVWQTRITHFRYVFRTQEPMLKNFKIRSHLSLRHGAKRLHLISQPSNFTTKCLELNSKHHNIQESGLGGPKIPFLSLS